MSTTLRIALFVALVAAVTAQQCSTNVTLANPYHRSNCTGYVMCERQLCACVGAPETQTLNGSHPEACLARGSVGCEAFTLCLRNFMGCLDALTSARSNATDPCNMWAVTLHAQLLQTVLTAYNGSKIQRDCEQRACQLRNVSGRTASCDLGANFSRVCVPRSVKVRQIVATLRLGGSHYNLLLEAPNGHELIRISLTTDISGLLRIEAIYVEILSVRLGSLIVEFAITEGSNATAQSMLDAIAAAGNSADWLRSFKALYRTVSNETITVEGFSAAIATTTGPGGSTPPPLVLPTPSGPATTGSTQAPIGAPSSSAAVSTLAVAVLAVLALVL